MSSLGNFYQAYKEELKPVLDKLFQETEEEGTFLKSFPREATTSLIPKPNKDSTRKENYRPVSWMNTDAKVLNKGSKTLWSSWDLPRAVIMVNVCKTINMIYHINKRKHRNQIIISVDAEKVFGKIQHPFMINAFTEMSIKRTDLSIIKLSETHSQHTQQ